MVYTANCYLVHHAKMPPDDPLPTFNVGSSPSYSFVWPRATIRPVEFLARVYI
jgi:hypothetical protein